jgi:hypothetical protein
VGYGVASRCYCFNLASNGHFVKAMFAIDDANFLLKIGELQAF